MGREQILYFSRAELKLQKVTSNPLFTPPKFITRADKPRTDKMLKDILDG